MKEPTDKEKLKNHKHFWDLVNILESICYDAIVDEGLYPDDIVGALEITKMNIWGEHIMVVMEEKFKSNEFLKEMSNEFKERKLVRSGRNAA